MDDGTVRAWGQIRCDGGTSIRIERVSRSRCGSSGGDVKQVSSGGQWTMFLKKDGTVLVVRRRVAVCRPAHADLRGRLQAGPVTGSVAGSGAIEISAGYEAASPSRPTVASGRGATTTTRSACSATRPRLGPRADTGAAAGRAAGRRHRHGRRLPRRSCAPTAAARMGLRLLRARSATVRARRTGVIDADRSSACRDGARRPSPTAGWNSLALTRPSHDSGLGAARDVGRRVGRRRDRRRGRRRQVQDQPRPRRLPRRRQGGLVL